jgi:predicted AlkP superfamily phosphohydrolase/phosphomutase
MTSPTRVLFLEVDAGDKHLVRSWARDGVLPNFRQLLARGLVGDSESVEGFFVGATWPCLYTGTNPAHHGIHSLVQQRPGTYEFFRCTTGEHIGREPFWNVLSRAGRRVAVLDIPLSSLSQELNGIQCVEWGSHDSQYGFCASPATFAADLLSRFGPYPVTQSCNAFGRTPQDFVEFRDLLVQAVRKKAALTTHYLRQGGWDFFGQVFTESHCVGHQCWHLHDPAHPAYDPAVVAVTGDAMRDVYVAIDAAIGEILAEVGPETTVIVLLGHRMAHKFGAQFLLPEILARLGVAVLRVPVVTRLGRLDAALTRIWQTLPGSMQNLLGSPRRLARRWLDARLPPAPALPPSVTALDAPASRVFLTDNGFPHSGLRLNLEGREPAGLVRVQEADAFCAQLTADLLALVHADNGLPMVKSVKRTKDLYRGEHLDRLPDLLVEWDDTVPLGSAGCGNPRGSQVRARSPKIGVVEGTNTYVRTGDHRREGLFIAHGPGLPAGRLDRTVSIMDFAPTFCALLGVELPDVDGRVIRELVAHAADRRTGA